MKRIYLIGYMGAGKTTAGKQLARMLELPFFDLDRVIEAGEKRSVPRLFSALGESGFRGIERSYLRRLSEEHESMVCATGGGTPCFYDNMQFMNRQGITVYLEMDVATIVHRITHSKDERPLLEGKSELELVRFVSDHLNERREFYEEAQIRFGALGMNKVKLESLITAIRAASATS